MGLKPIKDQLRDDQKLENYLDQDPDERREDIDPEEINDVEDVPLWKQNMMRDR